MSNFTIIMSACLLAIAISLFSLNYWHASKCSSIHSADDVDSYIEALNKRLIEAESQSIRNTILVNKLLHLIQVKLHQIETKELEDLSKQSQDEAVRLALILDKYPAPPMPEFEIDSKYKDTETLANTIDDIFRRADDKKTDFYSYSYGESKDKKVEATLSDTEATTLCIEWKNKYSVVTGVSWGNLPYDLQQKWLHYSCDYHLTDNGESSKTAEVFGQKVDQKENQQKNKLSEVNEIDDPNNFKLDEQKSSEWD